MLFAVEHNRLDNNAKMDSDAIAGRHAIVMNATHVIDEELLEAYRKKYKSSHKNSGNTTSQRSVTKDEIDRMDDILEEKARTGAKFFVQVNGVAALVNATKKDGTPFVVPADGAVLDCYPKGIQMTVTFRRNDFVAGIVYSSLLGRCGSQAASKCKGNTMQRRVQSFQIIGFATPKASSSLQGRRISS